MRVNLNKCQIFHFGVNQPFNAKANLDIFWYATTIKPHHLRDIISAIDNFSKSKQHAPNQSIQLIIKFQTWLNKRLLPSIKRLQTNTHLPKPRVALNAICFHMWQFQTNNRESYISYACGSSKVICNIQTNIAIEAPKASGYSCDPDEKLPAWNLLGTKRSSWLVVHRERLRKRVADCISLEVGYLRYGAALFCLSVVWKRTVNREVYGWEVRETITQDIDKRTKQFTLIRQGVLVDILYLQTMYNNL